MKVKDVGGNLKSVKVDTMEKLEGLSNTAVSKVKTKSEILYGKVLKDNIRPAKKPFCFQVSHPPASTTNEEMQILKSDLVDDNALMSFIKGFVGGIMQSYETENDE